MHKDNVKSLGTLTVEVFNADGELKHFSEEENLVVNTGFSFIAKRMLGDTVSPMSHMAIGTVSTAAAAAQTTLGGEVARVALDSATNVTTNVTEDSVQYIATFDPGVGTGAIVEAGIFNASTAGTMLNRTTFGVVNKAAEDKMIITWKVVNIGA